MASSLQDISMTGDFSMAAAGNVYHKDGSVTNAAISASAAIARSKLATDTSQAYPVLMTDVRTWDALHTNLPGTAASDDLALITGTWLTDAPRIRTSDGKATTVTQYGGFLFTLPPEYVAAASCILRLKCRMITTVSDTTATVDVEAVKLDESGAVGSDICATAATSINSLSAANVDFTITATSLAAGDTLFVRLKIAITDGATATAVIGQISRIAMLLSIQG